MDGCTDLEKLVDEHYHRKMKASKAKLVKAVTDRMTDHHRFMLRQIKHQVAYLEGQIKVMQAQMDKFLQDNVEDVALLCTIPGVERRCCENAC